MRPRGGGRPGARRRQGHPRLRQGRHPLRGRADRRFPRDGGGGSEAGGGAQDRGRRKRRAHRRPQLPGHALHPGARVRRLRQRRRRDRFPARHGVVRLPVRRVRLRHRQSRRGAGRGFSLLRLLGQRDGHRHARAALGLPRRSGHVAGLRLHGGHARCAAPPRRRAQVAGDGQAGADLEGRHHGCRHQGGGLAHRQHDGDLRSLPRGDAPVRHHRGGRRRAHRRPRQAVRPGPAAEGQRGRRAVDLGRVGRGVRRCGRARRPDAATFRPADARPPARDDPGVRLGREPGRHHRRPVQRHHAVRPHARLGAGGRRARPAGGPDRIDLRPERGALLRGRRRRGGQDRQARQRPVVGPAGQVGGRPRRRWRRPGCRS